MSANILSAGPSSRIRGLPQYLSGHGIVVQQVQNIKILLETSEKVASDLGFVDLLPGITCTNYN